METQEISNSVHTTALVLANAGELTAAILSKVAGNDISTAINGSPISRDMIQNLVRQKLEKAVSTPVL